jgi:hypothetical protein
MENHQSLGHIGGNVVGTNTYDVCMVFTVQATDDDAARDKVTRTLPKGRFDMEWAWIYTSLTRQGESNGQSVSI